ncbi:S-layer homology domain-containing protein [Mesotoga prima]|uniref:S-layer homology domain-containing protein n=1 Tax=Mesotoga prima TaxID=1184387 RepID=UPI002B8D42E9|nr:S-layer homology domain-containing protein [Mesotoga prima]HPA00394.1 S-layer homology domain-containing protein [Mesotoga prima]
MKKLSILTLIVVAFASLSLGVEYSDLSENHWAYDSVIKTTAGGLFIGFPDGTFRGSEFATRYQLAMTLARFMDYSDAGDAKLQEVVFSLTKKVAGLSLEISDNKKNLVDLTAELRALEATVASLKQSGMTGDFVSLKTFDDTVAFLYDEIDRLSMEAVTANEGIVLISERLDSMSSVPSDVEALKNRATDLEVTVKLLGQAIANLKNDNSEQAETVADLTSRFEATENVLNSVTSDLFAMRRSMATKDDLSALESKLAGEMPDLEPYVTNEALNDKLSLMYTRILKIQDSIAKMPEVKYYDAEIEEIHAAMENADETLEVLFDQVDLNISRLDDLDGKLAELKTELSTKASAGDVEAVEGRVTDLEVTTKMLSNAIIAANKRISELDYVTPEQLTTKMNFLYKKLGLAEESLKAELGYLEGELALLGDEVTDNYEMLEVAFDQIDANIAVLDDHADLIASLEGRTGTLEGKVGVLEGAVDSLESITNTMAIQMFKLDRNKADKSALEAAETRIAALEENDVIIEGKISALEETQKQNVINTNAAIILSFVALAFGAVGLILK